MPISPSSLPVNDSQVRLRTKTRQRKTEKIPGKKIIRELGLKVTGQREIILEVIRTGPNHFTAQDIFETVVERSPDIGFATVYRFLRKLSEHQYVTEVRMGGMPARYEWAARTHHDHLTCSQCHKIVEFENEDIERLQERVAAEFGFKLTDHVLELFGTCPDCQSQQD